MTDFGDWLRELYIGRMPEIGELSDDDRQIVEAAFIAYSFGADYYDKLAQQTTMDWQQSDFATGIAAVIDPARRKGRPVQQRDRLLIRVVADEWAQRGREVKLPASNPVDDGRDTQTAFSSECERIIRLIDPDRNQMPGRRAYENALPKT